MDKIELSQKLSARRRVLSEQYRNAHIALLDAKDFNGARKLTAKWYAMDDGFCARIYQLLGA